MLRLLAKEKSRPLSILAASSLFFAATAQGETEPIRIEYRASPGCPSEDQFRSAVFARTTSARPAAGSEAARTFVVAIEATRTGVVGSLVVRESSGATLARKVEGTRCEQVATALSLATALAIDPQAPEPTRPANGEAPDRDPDRAGEENRANASNPNRPTSAPRPQQARPDRNPSSSPKLEERSSGSFSDAWWSIALGPSLQTGVSPRLSLGASAALERHAAESWLSGVGVELSWLEGPHYVVSTASSSFRFLLARPFVCPRELPLSAFHIAPCLGVALGAVTGTGTDIPNAATETRFWAAGDAHVRARFEANERWFLEFWGAAVFPLTRYTFVFREPDTQIHQVPGLTAAAGLRLGFRI